MSLTETEGFKKWIAENELLDDILFPVSSNSPQSNAVHLQASNNSITNTDRFTKITEIDATVQLDDGLKIFQFHKLNPNYCDMCGKRATTTTASTSSNSSSSSSSSKLRSEQLINETETSKRLSDEALYNFAIMGEQNLQFECEVSYSFECNFYNFVLTSLISLTE